MIDDINKLNDDLMKEIDEYRLGKRAVAQREQAADKKEVCAAAEEDIEDVTSSEELNLEASEEVEKKKRLVKNSEKNKKKEIMITNVLELSKEPVKKGRKNNLV